MPQDIIALMPRTRLDRNTLEAALLGYQLQLKEVEEKITELSRHVDGQASAAAVPQPGRRIRKMSAAARRRIVVAQKKRWAAYHKQQGPTAKKTQARKAASTGVTGKPLAALAKARKALAARRAAAKNKI